MSCGEAPPVARCRRPAGSWVPEPRPAEQIIELEPARLDKLLRALGGKALESNVQAATGSSR
jgi:hypothetical protein